MSALPSDPESRNDARSARAGKALAAFLSSDRIESDDAVQDLLCDLAHYCDRNGTRLATALRSAKTNYEAETHGLRLGAQFDAIAIHASTDANIQ